RETPPETRRRHAGHARGQGRRRPLVKRPVRVLAEQGPSRGGRRHRRLRPGRLQGGPQSGSPALWRRRKEVAPAEPAATTDGGRCRARRPGEAGGLSGARGRAMRFAVTVVAGWLLLGRAGPGPVPRAGRGKARRPLRGGPQADVECMKGTWRMVALNQGGDSAPLGGTLAKLQVLVRG